MKYLIFSLFAALATNAQATQSVFDFQYNVSLQVQIKQRGNDPISAYVCSDQKMKKADISSAKSYFSSTDYLTVSLTQSWGCNLIRPIKSGSDFDLISLVTQAIKAQPSGVNFEDLNLVIMDTQFNPSVSSWYSVLALKSIVLSGANGSAEKTSLEVLPFKKDVKLYEKAQVAVQASVKSPTVLESLAYKYAPPQRIITPKAISKLLYAKESQSLTLVDLIKMHVLYFTDYKNSVWNEIQSDPFALSLDDKQLSQISETDRTRISGLSANQAFNQFLGGYMVRLQSIRSSDQVAKYLVDVNASVLAAENASRGQDNSTRYQEQLAKRELIRQNIEALFGAAELANDVFHGVISSSSAK